MESAKNVAVGQAAWKRDRWEDSSIADLVLEHYDHDQQALRRYLVCIGVDAGTAEDVVHDSFLKLHEHLANSGDRTHLRAWLYRVAHNLARNIQASFRQARTDTIDDLTAAVDRATQTESAEEWLLTKERLETLRQGLAQLSAAQRSCLTLRAQGFKYREIAEILGLTTSTVAENVQRGIGRLKEIV